MDKVIIDLDNHLKEKLNNINNIVLNESGEPLILYHGTNRRFEKHSSEKHRTVLNDKYQGDWFCFTDQESVAWKYAEAARNQNLDRDIFIDELKEVLAKDSPSNIHEDIYDLCIMLMDKGFSKGWENFEIKYREKYNLDEDEGLKPFFDKLREYEKAKPEFDLDELSDLLEYVEYSKIGEPDDLGDVMGMFNSSPAQLPYGVFEDLEKFGFEKSIPQPRVIACQIKAEKILKTDDREKALQAKKSDYDLVIYSGEGTVDGEPEYLVLNEEQIIQLETINKHKIVEETGFSEWSEYNYYEKLINNELSKTIRSSIDLDKIDKPSIEYNMQYHSKIKASHLIHLEEPTKHIEDIERFLLSSFIDDINNKLNIDDGKIVLYRALMLENISQLQEPLGKYWSFEEGSAEVFDDYDYQHVNSDKSKHKEYILKSHVSIEDIDWEKTFDKYNINEFMECEIVLKDNAIHPNIEYRATEEKEFTPLQVASKKNSSNNKRKPVF